MKLDQKRTPSQNAATLLGVDKVFSYQARLVRCVRKVKGMNQVTMGVVGLSSDDQDYNEKGEWERMDCDVIIVPHKKYFPKEDRSSRIDQIMFALSDDNRWTEETKQIKKNKKK